MTIPGFPAWAIALAADPRHPLAELRLIAALNASQPVVDACETASIRVLPLAA